MSIRLLIQMKQNFVWWPNDLEACEKYRLSLLPPRRRTIYAMSRFEDKSISDISAELNLSHRTVENHLRIGRHEVREFIKQCI